jgi:hypothetical protein
MITINEFVVMLCLLVYFVFDVAFVHYFGLEWVLIDAALRMMIILLVLIDNSQPNSDNTKLPNPYGNWAWQLTVNNGYWYTSDCLFAHSTPTLVLVLVLLWIGLSLLTYLLSLQWVVGAMLIVISTGWGLVVQTKKPNTTYNRFSRLLATATLLLVSGSLVFQWMVMGINDGGSVVKLGMIIIGGLGYIRWTAPHVVPLVQQPPRRRWVNMIRWIGVGLLIVVSVSAGLMAGDAAQYWDHTWSRALSVSVGVATLVVITGTLSVYYQWNDRPPLADRAGTSPIEYNFTYDTTREWRSWLVLWSWVMVWDWLLPHWTSVWSSNEWVFSRSARRRATPLNTTSDQWVSYDVSVLLLINTAFVFTIFRQWRFNNQNAHKSSPTPVPVSTHQPPVTFTVQSQHNTLQTLNWWNGWMVIAATVFNIGVNLFSCWVYLGQGDHNNWWPTRGYEDGTQVSVEMVIFDVVLMASLWPNLIGISHQLNTNQFNTGGQTATNPLSSQRWWWVFAMWNYWQYGATAWCFVGYPLHTSLDGWAWMMIIKNGITGLVVIASLSRVYIAPWPQLSGLRWLLYTLSVVLVWGAMWSNRTVVNYILVHVGVLSLLAIALITVMLHPRRAHLPYQHDQMVTVLWYDLLYASIYLVYIGTLHQLVRYDFDVLATIWRSFALNVASYFYVLAKYLSLPELPAKLTTTTQPRLQPWTQGNDV